jgi:hypothetical protein
LKRREINARLKEHALLAGELIAGCKNSSALNYHIQYKFINFQFMINALQKQFLYKFAGLLSKETAEIFYITFPTK